MSGNDFRDGQYDSLIGDSSVRLFGRLMWDIQLKTFNKRNDAYGANGGISDYPVPPRISTNNFLINQLSHHDANLARISSFSFQNEIFDLAKPAIFLVHGEGSSVEMTREAPAAARVLSKSPAYTERTGMVGQRGSFAPEIFVWVYDRADFTVRLDTETGTLNQVLIDFELGGPIGTGEMQAAGTDPPPPPNGRARRRRKWRSNDD